MQNNPVNWFEIYVDDMARAKSFYEGVFDVTLQKLPSDSPEMWAFPSDMNLYGAGGALVCMPGFSAGRNSVIIYFYCADCSVEENKIRALGGKIEKTKFSIGPYGHIALAYDTEGNMIGLHSPPV
jgi:uncharacterized protein